MPRFTNFPHGITSLGIPTFGTGSLPPYTGNYYFVQENYTAGASAGSGTATAPFNTLTQALASCVSGHNDVVFLIGTVHLTATLAWNKNNVHLVGIDAPLSNGKRARISTSGSTAFGPLVSVTGNGCQFENFGTFFGFAVTGATTPICWSDTGGRNCYNLVEFLGFGDQTTTTGTANQTTARAFVLNTNVGETTWRACTFGVNTMSRNATNYTMEIAGAAPRCTIDDCDFQSFLGSSGTASSHLLIGANGIDRELVIKSSRFLCSVKSTGSTMAQAFNVSGSAGGAVLLSRCVAFGITAWETTPSGSVYLDMGSVSAPGGGISLVL